MSFAKARSAAMGDAPMRAPHSLLPLAIEHVSYEAGGRSILADVSAHIESGLLTVILGPNGAGKSVLMRICHGLLRPTSGRIAWATSELPGAPRRQAMVFQHPVMLRRSALANIAYALELAGVPKAERLARAYQALEQVGLRHLADRPARVLSGGEQHRVAIARAWAVRPEVLFLDEPTANLDPGATAAIEDAIRAIHASGAKVVMTTHNLGQARRLADEILFLYAGRLAEHTPADSFFAGPSSDEARAFLKGEVPWH
jgi:tungstate transport system ATP-binding protein